MEILHCAQMSNLAGKFLLSTDKLLSPAKSQTRRSAAESSDTYKRCRKAVSSMFTINFPLVPLFICCSKSRNSCCPSMRKHLGISAGRVSLAASLVEFDTVDGEKLEGDVDL